MSKPLFKILTGYNQVLIADNEKSVASLFKMANDSRIKIVSVSGFDKKKIIIP